MIRKFLLASAIFASIGAQAQSYQDRCRAYIQQYQSLAQEEQRRSGVPAAITLGQGILETDAGRSELATEANNHFGIKCKKSWTGATFAHDDDAPQECFRKYGTSTDSYKDHSDYLKSSPRYAPCFALNPADYQGWARELRKCGYATNPKYAQQLIKIIEDYQLQDHTYAAMRAQPASNVLLASAASPAAATLMAEQNPGSKPADNQSQTTDQPEYGKVTKKDGVRGFYAQKGDVLLEYAIRFKIRYARLLELNGLPDAPLTKDQFVALESGNRIIQIISHDASQPAPQPTAEKTFAAASQPGNPAPVPPAAAPAKSTQPVSAAPVKNNPAPASQNPKPTTTVAAAPAPAKTTTTAVSAQPQSAPKPASTVAATSTSPKPFNIADEPALDDAKSRYIAPNARNRSAASQPASNPVNTPPPARPATAPVAAVATSTTVSTPAPKKEEPLVAAAPALTTEDTEEKQLTTTPVTEDGYAKNAPKSNEDEEDDEEDDEEPAKPSGTNANTEFEKMKARFDKVVYAPSKTNTAFSTPKSAGPASTTPATAPATKLPVASAAPATVNIPAQSAAGARYHVVKSGETAYGISKQYGISMKELMSMNHLNFEAIRVGQKLRVK